MRKIMLPLVFLTAVFGLGSLALVGCGGDDSTSGSKGKQDLATTKKDMTQVEDFTTPPLGCAAFSTCLNNCTTQACQTDCINQAGGENSPGVTEFFDLYDCLHDPCGEVEDDMDLGAGACRYNANTGAYDDQSACQACITGVENSGVCNAKETTCENDTAGE